MSTFLIPEQAKSEYRKTKIVATVGPASRDPEKLRQLIKKGVNVFRLNFSHGSHEEHAEVLNEIRKASDEVNLPVAVLQDLSGPKIRISDVKDDFFTLEDRDEVRLRFSPTKGKGSHYSEKEDIYVELVDPAKELKKGQRVLLADGLIELRAGESSADHVTCEVVKGGRVRSRMGIAFPDSNVDLPATTEKDLRDLTWGIEHGVEYVAISFVRTATDVIKLREEIKRQGGHSKIIAKIERKGALDHIYEILDVADGLMVARGDLGLELPLEQVPLVQKRLIEEANFRGIPVIVATQMLHSMITALRPTRAEVSDIATAVMSGTDAVMLSEETAIGENPLTAVEYLGRIALEAEQSFAFDEYKLRLRESDHETVSDAVAYAACAAAVKVRAGAVVACTETGNTARLIAKYRPQQPLFGASSSPLALRRMCLNWGVLPIPMTVPSNHPDELDLALQAVQTYMNFENGTKAVITGGLSVRTPGATSVMQIRSMLAK